MITPLPVEQPPTHEPPALTAIPLTCGHQFLTRAGDGHHRNSMAPGPGDELWCVRCDGPSSVPTTIKRKPRDWHMPPRLALIAEASRREGWRVNAVHQGAGLPVRCWTWEYPSQCSAASIRVRIYRKTTPTREWWERTLNILREIGAPVDAR